MIIFKKNAKRIRNIILVIISVLLVFILYRITKIFETQTFSFFKSLFNDDFGLFSGSFSILFLLFFVIGGSILGIYITNLLLPKENEDNMKLGSENKHINEL